MDADSGNDTQSMNDSDVVELLSDIEHKLIAAWIAGDSSFHERVLADDWSVIDGAGRIMSKTEMLNESFSGERQITVGQIDEIRVRCFGDWAIVTGRTHVAGRFREQEVDVTLRFTDVFAYRVDMWQVVASQATLLNK